MLADGDASSAGSVVVGEVAVRIEAIGQLVGQLAQLVGAVLGAQPSQLRLGLLAGLDVNEVGQPVHEAADDGHVAGSDVSGALRGGGRFQPWRQRFACDGFALAEVGSLVDASRCFAAGNAQPVG